LAKWDANISIFFVFSITFTAMKQKGLQAFPDGWFYKEVFRQDCSMQRCIFNEK